MLRYVVNTTLAFFLLVLPAFATQQIIAVHTDQEPVLDGVGDDVAWESSPTIITQDSIAKIPIELQSVYTNDMLYLKIRFPDETENREHKTLNWDKDLKAYKTGNLREDSFVIKWNMDPLPVSLSLKSKDGYQADIWFWKAFRTDPVGYADDKMHIFSEQEVNKAQRIILPTGKTMFLSRSSDSGDSTYKSIAYDKFVGDSVERYKHRQPTKSRADVRAKGGWADNYWTIEFQRDLMTGNNDDVQFNDVFTYIFGVSRFEIGGKAPNAKLEQPNYESGDVGENLELVFKK